VVFVGFTRQKDPEIHRGPRAHNFSFDALQIPLDCLETGFRRFETQFLPEANRREIAALGPGGWTAAEKACTRERLRLRLPSKNWATR
jgi:hypothetical protein